MQDFNFGNVACQKCTLRRRRDCVHPIRLWCDSQCGVRIAPSIRIHDKYDSCDNSSQVMPHTTIRNYSR
ncbi:hypothetical protein O3P69_017023 [Scylla paramamosain]|uniref:Uncharacterized protein n=1 Tax=Scylla paramamosain TaxID=85552 RepID=A0AAW0TTH1_SCYPA